MTIKSSQKGEFRHWKQTFSVEIGDGIPYPSQEERWAKYGEPLYQIFDLVSDTPSFAWYKDALSASKLVGVTVACLESKFIWEESQNDLVELGLLMILSNKINDLFTRLGASWAAATGVFTHPYSSKEITAGYDTFVPFVSAVEDPISPVDPIYIILQPEPPYYLASYIGRSFFRRLRSFYKWQILEIMAKGENVHVFNGFHSIKFGERENPTISVLPEEISCEQAKMILEG